MNSNQAAHRDACRAGDIRCFRQGGSIGREDSHLNRLRAIPLGGDTTLGYQGPPAIKGYHQPIALRNLPLGMPLSPTAPCAKWLRYPIGTCANRLSTATGDYIIITSTATNVTLEDYAREN